MVNYTIPCPYILESHIKVYVQGILKTADLHYTFLTSSAIQFSTAPLLNELITIKRESGRDARLVEFTTGSILSEDDQNMDSTQLFYLMQEAFDSLVLAGNEDGAIFTSPEAILNALTASITSSELTADLMAPIGYTAQEYVNIAIHEYDEDGDAVYEDEVFHTGHSRIKVSEEAITLLVEDVGGNAASLIVQAEAIAAVVADVDGNAAALIIQSDAIDAVVSDVSGHTSLLSLMANEFFVKLDDNGNVAGFGIYNAEETSQFIVNVDQFAIIAADGEGETYVPFIVDTETGLVGIDGNLLVTGSITAPAIGAGIVTATHIAAATIAAGNIVLGTITAAQIAENTISANRIIEGAITGTYISEDAISTMHVAANAITGTEIKAGEVDTDHLAALSVATAKIQVGAVTDTIIANGAVTTQKVYAGAITATHISTNEIIASAANIKNAVITGAKIANLTVDTLQIKGNAVTVPSSAYTEGLLSVTTSSNPGVSVQSVTLTVSGANPVYVHASFSIKGGTSPYKLYRDSTLLYSNTYDYWVYDEDYVAAQISFGYTDTPNGGSVTYYLYVKGGADAYAKCRSLFALEVKK